VKTKILSSICALVTGLILHTLNLYILGGGWCVFTLMYLDCEIYCTPLEATNLIVIVLSYGNVMMKVGHHIILLP